MFLQTLRRQPISKMERTEFAIALHPSETEQRRVIMVHVQSSMQGRGRERFAEGRYDATLTKEERAQLKQHVENIINAPLNRFSRAGQADVVDIEV